MAHSQPVSLSFLTPHPLSPKLCPAPTEAAYTQFTQTLKQEATALLDHPAWPKHQKEWHNGLVSTSALPSHAVLLAPPPADSAAAEDPSLAAAQPSKGKKLGFFGGGGSGSSDGKKEKTSSFEGLSFHQRTTILDPSKGGASEGVSYDKLWAALAEDHTQQEAEYVHNLTKVVELSAEEGFADTFLKLYDLPFPTQNRCFLSRIVVQDTTPLEPNSPRSFLVFSLPILSPALPEEKGFCRGRYVGVESVEELEEGGRIRWGCVSMSSPGGSLPHKLSETYMASSMASSVEPFLKWLKTKPTPEPRTLRDNTATAQEAEKEEEQPASDLAETDSAETVVGSPPGDKLFVGLEDSFKTMNLAERRAVAEVIAQ